MQSHDYITSSKDITYLDADNSYGWAMNQYLSYSEFKWLNKNEIEKLILLKFTR